MNNNIAMNYYTSDAETWDVYLDGRYTAAVQNYLEADGIPAEGVSKIIANAAQTLSYCPKPDGTESCK